MDSQLRREARHKRLRESLAKRNDSTSLFLFNDVVQANVDETKKIIAKDKYNNKPVKL